MKSHKLEVEKRVVTGKKVKQLRKQGLLPANVYGKSIKSQSLSVRSDAFDNVYNEVGETGLIELVVKGQKEPHHVLIHKVQIDPVSDKYVHIDFHEVALKEKIKVAIPVTITGESPIVNQKQAVLLHMVDEIEVEALPTDLPEEITVNITKLAQIGDEIKVGDIKVSGNYAIVTDPTRIIVKINPLEKEEAPAPVVPAEEAEAAAEGAPEGEAKEPASGAQEKQIENSPEKKSE